MIITSLLTSVLFLSIPGNCPDNIFSDDYLSEQNILTLIYGMKFTEAEKMIITCNHELEETSHELLLYELNWWRSIAEGDLDPFRIFLKDHDRITNENNSNTKSLSDIIYLSYKFRYEIAAKKNIRAIATFLQLNSTIELNKKSLYGNDTADKYIIMLYFNLISYAKHYLMDNITLSIKRMNRASDLENLELISTGNNYIAGILGHYFLGKIYLELENNYQKACFHFSVLSNLFPGNRFFQIQIPN